MLIDALRASYRPSGLLDSSHCQNRATFITEPAWAVQTSTYTAYHGEITLAVRNLILRDFHADAPNQKWLIDITEFQIPTGKVYLSPIINCFDGMVVSWTVSTSPEAGGCCRRP